MRRGYDLIDYMSGLTVYVLDETVYRTIAFDRGVAGKSAGDLTQKEKDLLEADILLKVYHGADNIPSFSRQHGQFSTTTGQQTIRDKEAIYERLKALYRKWDDPKLESLSEGSFEWLE